MRDRDIGRVTGIFNGKDQLVLSGGEFRKDRWAVNDPVGPAISRRERATLERVDLALNTVVDQDPDPPVWICGDGHCRPLQLRRPVHWSAAFGGNGPEVVDGQNGVRGAEERELPPTTRPYNAAREI